MASSFGLAPALLQSCRLITLVSLCDPVDPAGFETARTDSSDGTISVRLVILLTVRCDEYDYFIVKLGL
jgi:hypothetical protein